MIHQSCSSKEAQMSTVNEDEVVVFVVIGVVVVISLFLSRSVSLSLFSLPTSFHRWHPLFEAYKERTAFAVTAAAAAAATCLIVCHVSVSLILDGACSTGLPTLSMPAVPFIFFSRLTKLVANTTDILNNSCAHARTMLRSSMQPTERERKKGSVWLSLSVDFGVCTEVGMWNAPVDRPPSRKGSIAGIVFVRTKWTCPRDRLVTSLARLIWASAPCNWELYSHVTINVICIRREHQWRGVPLFACTLVIINMKSLFLVVFFSYLRVGKNIRY